MSLLKLIDETLSELYDIRRTHRANVNRKIVRLQNLRKFLTAQGEPLDIRAIVRKRRMRRWLISRFNFHCPICGVKLHDSRKWVVLGNYVQCRRCYIRNLRFEVDYADFIRAI